MGLSPWARTSKGSVGRRASAASCMARQLVNSARVRPPAAAMSEPSSSCRARRASGRRGSGRCLAQYSSAQVSKGNGLPTSRWSVPWAGRPSRVASRGGTVADVSTAVTLGHSRWASKGPTSMGAARRVVVRPDGPEDSTQATCSVAERHQPRQLLAEVSHRQQGAVAPGAVVAVAVGAAARACPAVCASARRSAPLSASRRPPASSSTAASSWNLGSQCRVPASSLSTR